MKKGKKKVFITLVLVVLVVLAGGEAFATGSPDVLQDRSLLANANAGQVASKEEVVYAKLGAGGTAQEAYIVNILSVTKAGAVTDRGQYASVKNLTTDTPIVQKAGGQVSADAPAGDFYYQGNIEKPALPWNIAITYELNGRVVKPESLAGATGKLSIRIETSRNDVLDPGWYDNLLMQISVTLDAALCRNIVTKDGMIANAGGNKLITFAVMPGKNGNLGLEADVVDFSMPGISFSAVALDMGIERPDTSEMTADMNKLSDGIGELDDGVSKLHDGAKELADGTSAYANGIFAFSSGLNTLARNADSLKKGAGDVGGGLAGLSQGLGVLGLATDALPGQIAQRAGPALAGQIGPSLAQNLSPSLARNLGPQLAQDIAALGLGDREALSQALTPALEEALGQSLSGALPSALASALTGGLEPALAAALTAGPDEQNPYGSYGYQVKEAAKGAAALSDGFNNPDPALGFASGLNVYLDGVKQASNGASILSGGAGDLSNGLSAFSDGVRELKDGTLELRTETADMPEKIEEKIDEMIGEYDKSDYVPLSFASPENGEIGAIQFVLTSEKIEKPVSVSKTGSSETEKSVIDRFFDLFR